MILAFETERTEVLEKFLDNWQNPKSFMTIIANINYVEFTIKKYDDLTIMIQRHILDVWAKYYLFGSIFLTMLSFLMKWNFSIYLGIIIFFGSVMWLSPYARFYAMVLRLKMLKHKPKINMCNAEYITNKLIYKLENEPKRDIPITKE